MFKFCAVKKNVKQYANSILGQENIYDKYKIQKKFNIKQHFEYW